MRVSSLLVFAVACSGNQGSSDTGAGDWSPVSYLDEGDVCFAQDGADVAVTLTVSDCLSGGCNQGFEGTCTATVDGSVITVTSDIHWEEPTGDVTCLADCGIPMATCTLSGLPDGSYTVVFGAEESALVVPIVEPCASL